MIETRKRLLVRVVCVFCVPALFTAAALVAEQGAPPAITLVTAPARVSQGGVVFVAVKTKAQLRDPSCEWLGETYPLYTFANGYRVALPIDRLQKTGPAALVVRALGFDEPLATHQINIFALNTGPAQVIALTEAQIKAEQDPRIEEQTKRIRELLRTRTPEPLWKGPFRPPSNKPGRNFGKRRSYVEVLRRGGTKPGWEGYHRGMDFPLPAGTPVRAAASGRVLAAEPFILSGNTVLIDHGEGIITGYFHLSAFRVKVGQMVKQGQVLGLVGSTGRSTGPHLHWQVYAQGRAANPAAILRLPAFFLK